MDVTCNRCGTVYEFEEGLISTTGTTVKCTQCGHLFKVHRPSPLPPPGGMDIAIEPTRWRVRRVDGSTHTLDSLADLGNLIGAGQFGADDEISRTGHVWKRLGEIAELSALFERPARPRRMSEPPPQPQLPIAAAIEDAKRTTASERPGTSSSDAPRRRMPTDPRFHVMGADVDIDSQRPKPSADAADEDDTGDDANKTAPHMPQPAPASSAPPPPAPPPAPPPPTTAPAPQPVSTPPQAAAPASTPVRRAIDPEIEDPMLAAVRRSDRGARAVMVACGLLLAGGIGAAALVQSRASTSASDPAHALTQRADAALAEHKPEAFQRAIGLYSQALALRPDDAPTLAAISRAYAIWSEWQREELQDVAGAPAAMLAAGATQEEAQRFADQAKQYAARAMNRSQGSTEAGVAFGDALRLTGDLAAARTEIERARASETEPAAETLRVAALLAIDAAGGVASAGRKLAEQAVARDPHLIRTRLLLARCLIDAKDADAAQQQLDALNAIDAQHPALPRLAQQIEALREQSASAHNAPAPDQAGSPAAIEKAPAVASKPAAAAPATPVVAVKPAPAPAPAPAPSTDAVPETNDPSDLVRQGEKALERGAVPAAESAFQRALEIDPHFARAKTGLGFVALERNQPNAAIAYFRPASQHGHAEAFIGMGDAFRRLGRARDALDAYQAYLKRFPDGPRRSIAQHQSELLSEQLETNH